MAGLNDFGGTVKLESVEISGATKEYVIADISFQLVNPSNITITVGDINFDVIMNEFNTKVGRVYVKDAIIAPGANSLKGELHLGEDVTNDKAIGQTFSDYLTSAKIPLTISGSKDSTAIPPLVDAFSSVKLSTEMAGIAGNLIETIAVKGTIIGLLFENKANAVITLKNPLGAPFSITDVDASVTFTPSSGGSKFNVGTIKYTPSPVTTVPAKGSATTGEWPVDLVKGQLLQLIGMVLDSHKVLDVQQNVTVNVGDGYKTSMFYYQDQVPFTISIDGLDLTGLSIPSSLSSNALSQGLTTLSSSMDDSTANNVLRNILSGNTKNVTSSASGSSSATTTTGGGLLGGLLPSKTDSSSSTTAEAKSNPTENSKSETTTAAQATTTTKERAFSLPFGL